MRALPLNKQLARVLSMHSIDFNEWGAALTSVQTACCFPASAAAQPASAAMQDSWPWPTTHWGSCCRHCQSNWKQEGMVQGLAVGHQIAVCDFARTQQC